MASWSIVSRDRLTFSQNVTISHSRVAEVLRQKSGREGKSDESIGKDVTGSRGYEQAQTPVTLCPRRHVPGCCRDESSDDRAKTGPG